MESKNYKQIASFVEYCVKHPDEKFWQALRNWNQIENPNHNFILTAEIDPNYTEHWINLTDTFYK